MYMYILSPLEFNKSVVVRGRSSSDFGQASGYFGIASFTKLAPQDYIFSELLH